VSEVADAGYQSWIAAFAEGPHEGPVDLDLLELDRVDSAQRRLPRAEIIDRELEPACPQAN